MRTAALVTAAALIFALAIAYTTAVITIKEPQ